MADKEQKDKVKDNSYKVVGKTKVKKESKKEDKVKGKVTIEDKAKKQLEKEKEKFSKEDKTVIDNKKVNKVLLTILLLLAIVVIIIGILYGGRVINKAKLDNEINSLASKSIENDDFSNIEINTSGEYAVIEKCIKEFYSEYSGLKKDFMNKINDEKIQNMLGIENYKKDGPEFEESLAYIASAKEEFNRIAEEISNMLTKQSIMGRIESENLDSYYTNLYASYFLDGDNLIEDLQTSYQDVQDATVLMNNLYDNETKILNFLVINKNNWEILDDKLTFNSATLSAEYNTLKTQLYAE